MRQALLSSTQQQRPGTVRSQSLAAPVRGWNTRDPLAAMDPLSAVQLVNLFPMQGELQMRGGMNTWATGLTGPVKSVWGFQSNHGTSVLFAATDVGIYDVTAPGAAGFPVMTLAEGIWDAINFTNSFGDNFLWGVNGVDTAKMYNGTVWSVPTITGVTSDKLLAPWIFKRRIWCAQKDTFNAWYLPTDSIQGLAKKFPLGGLFKLGGYLIGGSSVTIDGGDGPDDFCAFMTSEGELALYQGTDPSSASSFSIIGKFFLGRPLSRRCFQQYGGDLLIHTEAGVFPVSQLMKGKVLDPTQAISDNIRPTMMEAGRQYRGNQGWSMTLFATRNALIVNIPATNEVSYQYVMNTITGAWCSFLGWDARHFAVYNGALYFGQSNGTVSKCWDGTLTADNGLDITGTMQQAYNYYGNQNRQKQIKLARPQIGFDSDVEVRLGYSADFDPATYTSIARRSTTSIFSTWDIDPWDTSPWAGQGGRSKNWIHASCQPGFALSTFLQLVSKTATLVSLSGIDYQMDGSGIM